jgi:hypothetical protein
MPEEKFQTYLIDYDYSGSRWSFDIPATSFEDAMARIKQAASQGCVVGVKYAEFPVWMPVKIGMLIARFNEWRSNIKVANRS